MVHKRCKNSCTCRKVGRPCRSDPLHCSGCGEAGRKQASRASQDGVPHQLSLGCMMQKGSFLRWLALVHCGQCCCLTACAQWYSSQSEGLRKQVGLRRHSGWPAFQRPRESRAAVALSSALMWTLERWQGCCMQGGCCEEQAARTSSAGNAGIALGPVRARDRRSPRLSPLGGPGAEEPSNGASSSPPELELAFAAMLRRGCCWDA